MSYGASRRENSTEETDVRIRWAGFLTALLFFCVTIRLFFLMIVQHGFYTALAEGNHEGSAKLFPKRGQIYIQDSRTKEEYPLAINRDYFLVYADTRQIEDDTTAESVAEQLSEILGYDAEKKLALYYNLSKRTDPYEPIEQKIDEKKADQIKEKKLPGIGFVRQSYRYYPEETLASQVVGFVGKNDAGDDIGRYGIEGYWHTELAGSGGIVEGLKSAGGRWIPLAGRIFEPANDGADLLLTIDRTLEYQFCKRLKEAREEYQASSASLIMMDPKTGAIRVMCNAPDFDPNAYGKVESSDVYNNLSIFTQYEPGSVFKPLTIAAAINEEVVTPQTLFTDTGSVNANCSKPIQNANDRSYGAQTMVGVLENSINTGLVFAVNKLGKTKFKEYVNMFGFGVKDGIELDTEVSGNIAPLDAKKGDTVDCYTATASFGQGITVTPLQMITAISAIANGGTLMKPYIVEQVRRGKNVAETKPTEVRKVLTPRTASLVAGMMVSVVDKGQAKSARVPGYYVAGKTGTAQIAGPGGYSEETNHTFVGFAPVDNPKFAMIIKFEKPQRNFADSTAAPLFAELAKIALQYYEVAPTR